MLNNTFEELKLTGNLPSPSGIGMKILKLTQGEDFSTEEIGQTIMADSALTGRLLKLANSAQAGSLERISTVSEATIRLGVQTVRNVALGLSLISANRSGVCAKFDYDKYWGHSVARAVAAQTLSRRLGIGVPAEAYICALLSEVGYLALASVYPEKYSTILSRSNRNDPAKLTSLERKHFGIDHREIGALMLLEWGLPEDFSEAVREYEESHRQLGKGTPFASLTDLLIAAELLADVFTADEDVDAERWKALSQAYESTAARCGIQLEEFHAFANGIARDWNEWCAMLDIPNESVEDFAQLHSRHERVAQGAPAPTPGEGDAETGDLDATDEGTAHIEEQGLRILAVDDDLMSLRMLTKLLTSAGHRVTTAANGNEALRLALQVNPQIVLSDWIMPEMDGLDLCKSLRRIEHGRNMYFLLFSGRDEEKRVVEAFDAGVDDFVTKPFNPRLLMARLKGGQRIIRLQEQVEEHAKKVRAQAAELGMMNRKLRAVALTDVLTQLPNRRYAMKRLEQQWAASARAGRPLSVIMLDIDYFKKVNDEHGHDIGDIVLQETAKAMKAHTREDEEPCRLGGEEFLVICGNTTKSQAAAAAERLRAAAERNIITQGTFHRAVTLSLGVAQMAPGMDNPDALLKAADEAVYAAKEAGRNQVCIAEDNQQHKQSA